MADVTYKKCLYTGLTVSTIPLVLTATVEVGDIVAPDGTKGVDADTKLLGLAMEGGVSGETIPVLPMLPGMIFEAELVDTVAYGDLIGIVVESTVQKVGDSSATVLPFVALGAGDDGDTIEFSVKETIPAPDATA